MPVQPIPFGMKLESGYAELAGGSPQLMNLIVDGAGAVRRRPGLAAYSRALATVVDANGISGLHATSGGKLFAVGNHPTSKNVYLLTDAVTSQIGTVSFSKRPVFAETESMLAIAGGWKPHRIILDGYDVGVLSEDAPTYASHIAASNNRLLANDLDTFKNQMFFSDQSAGSDTTGNAAWASGTAGYVSADARPDPIVAIHENSNEVYCFGSTNTQVFVPDADLIYASATTREHGCIAPYSIVKVDQEFGWLDNKKRFVFGSARSIEVISGPIEKQLDAITTFSDCFGYYVDIAGVRMIVWTFPTDGRTFVFNPDNGWSQWSGWNAATGAWAPFAATACVQRSDYGDIVVGTSDGYIAEMLADATDDLGTAIKASTTTGFINRGTSKLKNTVALRLTLRRGTTTSTTAPTALLSFRDDFGAFSEPLPVDLGAVGDTTVVVEYRSLGTYRSRQWKLEFFGTDEFELVAAEEDFTVQEV